MAVSPSIAAHQRAGKEKQEESPGRRSESHGSPPSYDEGTIVIEIVQDQLNVIAYILLAERYISIVV
jgi:hypothetical protein